MKTLTALITAAMMIVLAGSVSAGGYGSSIASNASAGSASLSGAKSGSVAGFNFAPVDNSTYTSRGSDLSKAVPNLVIPGPGGGGANPCINSKGVGLSGPGFSAGASTSYDSKECTIRMWTEYVISVMNLQSPAGQQVLHNLWCQSPVMSEALDDAATATGERTLACTKTKVRRGIAAAPRAAVAPEVAPKADSTYLRASEACSSIQEYGAYERCLKRNQR